jgi:AraC-like DNA-binding protein
MEDYMNIYDFEIEKPVSFNWSGKFEAPDENWIHITRELLDFELILMTSGTLYIGAGDRQFTVHPGEYLLLAPPCHQYGVKPSRCSFYWTHFTYNENKNNPLCHSTNGLHSAPAAEKNHILLPETAAVPRSDRLVVLLKQLQDSDRKYRNINQNDFTLTAILCELYSQLYLSGSHIAMKGEKMQLYTDIIDYISWRIHENIKVSEIAAYFGYNEKYITTFFKKANGTSLKLYIQNRKMELAKAMLSDTNLPVAQIGYDIGFSDNHNFSSAFKKITGQSPSEYRSAYSEGQRFHE